jgi:putative acetyltransferase
MEIREGGLEDARVRRLLEHHVERARLHSAPGSSHALDMAGVRAPDVRFWTVWEGETLLGTGALKRLAPDHFEIKSMHTAQAARRRGVGGAMLERLIETAWAAGAARLSLETGSWDYFQPAVRLYRRYGFAGCGPFGDYVPDPGSLFMTLTRGARSD